MKANAPDNTIHADAVYVEACRIANELAAKKNAVEGALNRELARSRDRDHVIKGDQLIANSLVLLMRQLSFSASAPRWAA